MGYDALMFRNASPAENLARVFLLTGDRAAGKSTLCERLTGEARRRGLTVGGVACPAVPGPDGVKVGCLARNLAAGDEWELGSTVRDLGGPRWKGWSFSEDGFRRANRAVKEALDSGAGFVVLDEIGPVELHLGAGLEPSLACLDALCALDAPLRTRPGRDALDREASGDGTLRLVLVVRPELLNALSSRYPDAAILSVSTESRECAYESARSLVFGGTAAGKNADSPASGRRQGEQG